MPTDKSEVEEFLREVGRLISQSQTTLVPRRENLLGLVALGLVEEQIWPLIARLTIHNYHRGPEDDRDRADTWVWKFGRTFDKKLVYIKLKIETEADGQLLKCLSFHPALYPLDFPLRP